MDPLNFAKSGKQAFPLRHYRNWASGASFATDPTPRLGAAVKAPNPPEASPGLLAEDIALGFSEFSEKVFASLRRGQTAKSSLLTATLPSHNNTSPVIAVQR